MALLIFLIILSILVVAHEFGHFIAAKKAKVRVEVFSIGFGRKLISRKKGDTEYAISMLPFGGYVKMAGDNAQEAKGAPDEFLGAPASKRFWIVFLGPLLIMCLEFCVSGLSSCQVIRGFFQQLGQFLKEWALRKLGLPQETL